MEIFTILLTRNLVIMHFNIPLKNILKISTTTVLMHDFALLLQAVCQPTRHLSTCCSEGWKGRGTPLGGMHASDEAITAAWLARFAQEETSGLNIN